MNKLFNLKGKVIAITGGYGHLGKAITEGLLSFGGDVWVLARDKDKFELTFDHIKSGRKRLSFCYCDISEIGSIKKALKEVYDESGSLDVLINNAFYMSGRKRKNFDMIDWNNGIEGILSSTYWCIRESIYYLKQSQNARIINVASTHGMLAPDKEMLKPPQYGVAKAGVIQLTKYFASYLGTDNITVNTITPGSFPDKSFQNNDDYIQNLVNRTMLKRIGEAQELVGSFVFLSSDASSYITGHNLVVDGGTTAG